MKKLCIIALPIFIFSCSESNKTKLTQYCMDTLNTYSSVSEESCACVGDFLSKKLSQSEIDTLVSKPFGQNPLLLKEEANFLTLASESGCIK